MKAANKKNEDGEEEENNGDESPAKEPNEEEGEGEEAPAEEAPVVEEKEEPINVDMDGDSDDDFKLIEIKEKVKAFKEDKSGRIPESMINEIVRWRLFQNDCQNRGYVLDGFPRNFH